MTTLANVSCCQSSRNRASYKVVVAVLPPRVAPPTPHHPPIRIGSVRLPISRDAAAGCPAQCPARG
eukprot:3629750-Pyramimonas_sp.AAC.3